MDRKLHTTTPWFLNFLQGRSLLKIFITRTISGSRKKEERYSKRVYWFMNQRDGRHIPTSGTKNKRKPTMTRQAKPKQSPISILPEKKSLPHTLSPTKINVRAVTSGMTGWCL